VAGGHPSDADREEASLPALQRLLRACRERDAAGIAALYRDDAGWLADGETVSGGAAAARRHAAVAEQAASWDEPQQRGARAVLRWTGPDGSRGAVVVEVRRGVVVFAASG
jgi:ketosteroid isomerase-like protein